MSLRSRPRVPSLAALLAVLAPGAAPLVVPLAVSAATAVTTQGMALSDLAAADRNADGRISRSEWARHHREWFHLMDRNRDGFISRNERQMHRVAPADTAIEPTADSPAAASAGN